MPTKVNSLVGQGKSEGIATLALANNTDIFLALVR